MIIDDAEVKEWVGAAYEYYWGFEGSPMSDSKWDFLAREIHKNLSAYEHIIPTPVFNKMKEYEWDGGSLFFVPKDAYL